MSQPLATVVIVPRERFSLSIASLESVVANSPPGTPLVVVDGNSPHSIARGLAQRCEQHGIRLLRSDRYLAPNAARNLGAAHVRTRYVVFVDNDVMVEKQWLRPLVEMAESSGAWAVGPLYCQGLPTASEVHMAGGDLRLEATPAGHQLIESHRFLGRRVHDVRSELRPGPTENLEFHTMLMRMEYFDRFGPLDEKFTSMAEYVDALLPLHLAKLPVMLEPRSVITYVTPQRFAWDDLEYFQLRWSIEWVTKNIAHMQQKWNLEASDPYCERLLGFMRWHRPKILASLERRLSKWIGVQRASLWRKEYLVPWEKQYNSWRFSSRSCAPGARFSGEANRRYTRLVCEGTPVESDCETALESMQLAVSLTH
ncbi:glycosyl transferase family 2 [Pirellula staleyi DSM 6068]|uniref:Glycosyl transferase family 2 n=1 Tax=Pirellula staleyi (strain ATCC 27377 / DSM 6068 / ICPB 4128) TaxID=530564 RepID=D2R6C7_PIRSD|nr:glycosyltransferase [Pirellula staleyi]ADB15505.1 glycosyl transferase family 2 [Pirellula staleyi DSM 6068]